MNFIQANDELNAALEILAERGWYSSRPKDVQRRLAMIAKLRQFEINEPLYLAGDTANGVFGLVNGALNISFPRGDGEDYVMHRAGSGFWIGDLALFSQEMRLVSVHTAEPTTMVQLPTQELMKLVLDDPRLYADFYALTYENFKTTFKVVTNLSISSLEARVADRLLLEAAVLPDAQGWVGLSQHDFAALVALSLPTFQRVITRFARMGLVEKGYGRIRVVDREGLRRVCMQ